MLVRVRITIPDQPGALGRVASAFGTVGADIVKVDVLDSESGRAVDDVFVELRDQDHLVRVLTRLEGVPGLAVVGVQYPAPPVSGHAELELVRQIVTQPERGLRILLDGAPGAFGADWGALVRYGVAGDPDGVVGTSPGCPGADRVTLRAALRLGSVRMTPPGAREPYGGTAVVPVAERLALVLVRREGPVFHRSELWRLEQVAAVAERLSC